LRSPWTNVYGLARTIVASATALTLITSSPDSLWSPFRPGETQPLGCKGLRGEIGLFCIFPPATLPVVHVVTIVALLVIASGWRPRYTGVVHWWISFSFLATATLDGGEQVAALLTLFLVPWTLTDPREWHWQSPPEVIGSRMKSSFVANVSWGLVRLQVMVVYLHSAWTKLEVREWTHGTAIYYWTHDTSVGLPSHFSGLVAPLIESRPVIAALTWGAIAGELLLVVAIAAPKRFWPFLFWLGVAFHTAIALGIGVVSFSLTMIGALIVYLWPVDSEFVWLRGTRRGVREPAAAPTAAPDIPPAGTAPPLP
jgi:antimicrobial peptide system SdpB family protein